MGQYSNRFVSLSKIPKEGIEIPIWMSYTSFKLLPIIFIAKINVGNFLKVFEDRIKYNTWLGKVYEKRFSEIGQVDARFGKYLLGKNGIEESTLLTIKFKKSIFAFACIFWQKNNGIELLKLFKREGIILSERADKLLAQ